jgi:hypothetical protein
MNEIVRFALGLGVIALMVVLYAWVTQIKRKTLQDQHMESCDTTPQGGCCGQHDACTFDAKVQKFDGTK